MKIIDNLKLYLPFSYMWLLRRSIGKPKTILDVGCSDGNLMELLSRGRKWQITGVELYEDSIKEAEKRGVYQKVIKGDVTNLPTGVKSKKYDVIFCSQVLEHLTKAKGEKALNEWERLSGKRIIISTPVGFIPYEKIEVHEEEENPHQKHLSGWQIKELIDRGYQVRGQGAAFIYGKNGIARKLPSLLFLFSVVSMIFAPLVYFFPHLATYMLAWKDK